MVPLIFNSVLRIESDDLHGFYRVVAAPAAAPAVWLAFLASWQEGAKRGPDRRKAKAGALSHVARATIWALAEGDAASVVSLQPGKKVLVAPEQLTPSERKLLESRQKAMEPFLNHEALCDVLLRTGKLGELVQRALKAGNMSRASIYRLWPLLCEHGFEPGSLNPRFERCGAPGVLRPVGPGARKSGRKSVLEKLGAPVPYPQRGVTEEDRAMILRHAKLIMKPGLAFPSLYKRLIERCYVTKYEAVGDIRKPVLPPQGTFPDLRQVRHILESGVDPLTRLRRTTTQGHFDRNMRGLRGRAHDGVAGPGYVYAIDATIGDVHLRSSVNRAWPIGRPIVYVVVDVWSTAIVGFYVCLSGPSWAMAKLALFSTACCPNLLAELWGYGSAEVLSPSPTLPFQFLCDRGEYLSALARELCARLAVAFAFNPAYRPDLKGMVEVLHRIAKDTHYSFLPGAIDARRRELELKTSAKESQLTLREYAAVLQLTFAEYNLTADRSHRLTANMIGAGVDPSPAGLWNYGHSVGCGYQKSIAQNRLATELLYPASAIARRDGIFMESLQYEAPIALAEQWTAQARNFGVVERNVLCFPGSVSRFWWTDPAGHLQEFMLRPNARASSELTMEEWRDSLAFDKTKRGDREYARLAKKLEIQAERAARVRRAVEQTEAAEAAYRGELPSLREAREIEKLPGLQPMPSQLSTPQDSALPDDEFARYQAMMDDAFAELNRGQPT